MKTLSNFHKRFLPKRLRDATSLKPLSLTIQYATLFAHYLYFLSFLFSLPFNDLIENSENNSFCLLSMLLLLIRCYFEISKTIQEMYLIGGSKIPHFNSYHSLILLNTKYDPPQVFCSLRLFPFWLTELWCIILPYWITVSNLSILVEHYILLLYYQYFFSLLIHSSV